MHETKVLYQNMNSTPQETRVHYPQNMGAMMQTSPNHVHLPTPTTNSVASTRQLSKARSETHFKQYDGGYYTPRHVIQP